MMGRPPIGQQAMTAAERQRKRRALQQKAVWPTTSVVRLDDSLAAFRRALWNYAQCLACHRKRLKTDHEFQNWFSEETEDGDFEPGEVTALLAMAEMDYTVWEERVDLAGVVQPHAFLEDMQNVTDDVTKQRGELERAPPNSKKAAP